MKKLFILIICLGFHSVIFSQILSDFDEVSPVHEGFAAVKKGDQWGFIDKKGRLAVDFRSDFVLTVKGERTAVESLSYPVFTDGRCLIKKLINNINYFGYIDNKGNEIIEPQYLNATNFKNGFAIIVKLYKEVIGFNEVLKKDVIATTLEEYVIDTSGEIVKYLENPRNYVPSKSGTPPRIHSKFISPSLIAVQKKDSKWDIYKY